MEPVDLFTIVLALAVLIGLFSRCENDFRLGNLTNTVDV
jgi:hypothetical protein